jgi:hypothetical protein
VLNIWGFNNNNIYDSQNSPIVRHILKNKYIVGFDTITFVYNIVEGINEKLESHVPMNNTKLPQEKIVVWNGAISIYDLTVVMYRLRYAKIGHHNECYLGISKYTLNKKNPRKITIHMDFYHRTQK